MPNEVLANIVEEHKQAIAHRAANTVVLRQLPYYRRFDVEQLAEYFVPTVEMMIHYLQAGAMTGWSEYVAAIAKRAVAKGFSAQDVGAAGGIITEEIKEVIKYELPGTGNLQTRERFFTRLQMIYAIGMLSATSAGVKT